MEAGAASRQSTGWLELALGAGLGARRIGETEIRVEVG